MMFNCLSVVEDFTLLRCAKVRYLLHIRIVFRLIGRGRCILTCNLLHHDYYHMHVHKLRRNEAGRLVSSDMLLVSEYFYI